MITRSGGSSRSRDLDAARDLVTVQLNDLGGDPEMIFHPQLPTTLPEADAEP
ncbi:MAG: hypothetical protein J2P23_15635 [Microlunatus sp.]|nr:hypothetical protein [Microlunatus sp.]